MSTLTGCYKGALVTGLIDPDVRADAYTSCTDIMRKEIPTLPENSRKDVKKAVMTSLYGSVATPKEIFGDGTPELNAFYKALVEMAPGAVELLSDLKNSWIPFTSAHAWVLPDNHQTFIPVTDTVKSRITVDEIGGASFTYQYEEVVPTAKGLSNAANYTHSVDSYVLRSLVRRCSYDRDDMRVVNEIINIEVEDRINGSPMCTYIEFDNVDTHKERYEACKVADATTLTIITANNVGQFTSEHLLDLQTLVHQMLKYEPFEIVTVHDSFGCHANNCNAVRYHYKEILASLADGTMLDDFFTQIMGKKCRYPKLTNNLSKCIRNSNYSLG